MSKVEFVEKLAKKTKLPKRQAETIINTALELIINACARKERVTLAGFGSFEARQQKATIRINPQTGRKMAVPAKLVLKFRPGKAFKEALAKRE